MRQLCVKVKSLRKVGQLKIEHVPRLETISKLMREVFAILLLGAIEKPLLIL